MIIQTVNHQSFFKNKRLTAMCVIGICVFTFLMIIAADHGISDQGLRSSLEWRNHPPHTHHLFGTDWLGRDMFTRVVKGLNLSLTIGLVASLFSTLIAIILGVCSGLSGGMIDSMITWVIDLFLSLPHLVFLVLISFAVGGGAKGVVIGVALTHWPSLARVIRAEVLQLLSADYVHISSKLGYSNFWIARHHLLPHLIPQCLVGFILLFPHAILHEAGMSFIGVGLPPHSPAIGIILSESLRHLSTGYWWLAVIPGACLLLMVKLFDILGEQIRDWINPRIIRS